MLVGSNCWCDCPGFSLRSINWRGIWEEYNGVNRVLDDPMIIAFINDLNETARICHVCCILQYKVTRVGITAR